MIDFDKIFEPQKAIVPIVNKQFKYNRKLYSYNTNDGWHNVLIQNNDVLEASYIYSLEIISDATKLGRVINGYAFNSFFIFQNMDFARRLEMKSYMVPLSFYAGDTFASVQAILYEDKNLYYYKLNYFDYLIFDVKSAFDNNFNITNLKNITPELKMVYLLHAIEKQKVFEELERIKKIQEHEELLKTLAGRLHYSFENVGAVVHNYVEKNDTIEVIWRLTGSDTQYNTILDKHTFRVKEAGYCMSGDDRSHSVSSLVLTAKDYEEQKLTYITRR